MTETITHIVLFKYRPDITWADFETHFESFMGLKTKCINPKTGKPLIKSMKAGRQQDTPNYQLRLVVALTRSSHRRQESLMGTL